MNTQMVSGRQFRNAADYEAALKDAAYIDALKKRYDLNTKEGVTSFLQDIRSGKYRFRTILGQDLKEELEELLEQKKKEAAADTGKSKKGKRSGSGISSPKKSSAKKQNTKKLEDYDADMQKSILQELKKRERIRKLVMVVCLCMAGGCFVYLGIYSYQTSRLDAYAASQRRLIGTTGIVADQTPETVVIHYDNQELVVPDVLDDYKTLYTLNKNLIGWVKIDDTYIDYPVLQTTNNEYYLDHNFDQEQDKNGSIFLDKDCSIFPRSDNLIIYGHHMRSGRMFGQLNKYSSESFYEDHKYIQFDTIYEMGTYEVMYVFRSKIYEESEIVFKYYQFTNATSEIEFNSYMREMAEMSLYDTGVTAQYGDELLTLSTCDYYTDYGRFVVVAKRIY
ncbi:MAG: class B sortase [Lachnospiraceae bacterium]|nr:class B sortase [Lachnospiraceae bacterium]